MTISQKRKNELNKISQYLCFVLRHKPEAAKLDMTNQGWVAVSQLLANISHSKKTMISLEELNHIVESDSEGRYSFSADLKSIRCLQGHSLDWVNINYPAYEPKEELYHGTKPDAVESILKSGLNTRGRNYVHLSTSPSKASRVGKRHSKDKQPTILIIDKDAPLDFKISDNGVVLIDHVPSQYIRVMER